MLNEHDIETYKNLGLEQPEPNSGEYRLYQLERDSYFCFSGDEGSVFKLDSIDGMYSICYGVSPDVKEHGIFHFAAFTPVIKLFKYESEKNKT